MSLETVDTPIAQATVDLDAIAHNTALFAERTRAAVMAVARVDGFGHGALQVARAALASSATWLAVTDCAEALALRSGGVTAPMLSWMHTADEQLRPAITAGVDLSVSSTALLERVATAASVARTCANVQLDGTAVAPRGGLAATRWQVLARRARELKRTGELRVRGVWSQLVSGGGVSAAATRSRCTSFDDAVTTAYEAGLRPELRHHANSVAAVTAPKTHHELRPGIGSYGVEPDHRQAFGLRGAMTLTARLVTVKRVPPPGRVSHGHGYVTTNGDHLASLALVPTGYSDGIPWPTRDRGQVSLAGRRYPIAGRERMDQFIVDLGARTARPGDEVVAFGPGDRGEATIAEWADWSRTIPHEILTGVGRRVPRTYVSRGRAVEMEEP